MRSKHGGRDVKRLTDPKALRALAHPVRLKLVGLLRQHGPLTATKAASLIGESSGTTSFHLRQLAKYGLVEEAHSGEGRERPWQATAMSTDWPDVADTPELAAATGLLRSVIAERYFELVLRWIQSCDSGHDVWPEASHFGDTMLWLTEDELRELGREEQAMMERFLDRHGRPELRPADARLVSYLHLAFPTPSNEPETRPGRHDD